MGHGNSSQGQPAPERQKAKKNDGQKRLLDIYVVGDLLGQGTFGVVYACKPKGGPDKDREMAVKMVDKVETPVDKIKEEALFMKRLDDPSVVRCYDIIFEKCFVCIVMDRLAGGDLIAGMQAHWKSKGRIAFDVSGRICCHMARSLHYMHSQNFIHRDVKGDNYLMDRPDITDPSCRIVLTDFGTAKELKPAERLHDKCGTKLYWSPEFYRLDYSMKVDIWAMGVVSFGLLLGRFPFRNETEVVNKKLSFNEETPADCKELVQSMLQKREDQRATAEQVLDHPRVSDGTPKARTPTSAAPVPVGSEHEDAFIQEGGANDGIRERRHELVERLVEAQDDHDDHETHGEPPPPGASRLRSRRKSGVLVEYWKDRFEIIDKRGDGSTLVYEWWPAEKSRAELDVFQHVVAPKADHDHERASVAVIGQMLREHNIDTAKFGTGEAKTLDQLAAEVQSGAAVLMLDAAEHKTLVRVVDIVLLRIFAPVGGDKTTKYMVETSEQYADGRHRDTYRLPGTKKEPSENSKQTATRIIEDLLAMGGHSDWFTLSTREQFEEKENSPSYPGVMTVYRKEIIELVMKAPDDLIKARQQDSSEWSVKDKTGNTKFFKWMDAAACEKHGVHLRSPEEHDDISALVQAPIGMEEEELRTYFETHKVDISRFGQNKAKTLKDIAAELQKGESTLVHGTDGRIIRIVDVVLLNLAQESGRVLVQTEHRYPDGVVTKLRRLPGSKRRPDENQFLAAKRIVARQLRLEENLVTTSATDVQVVEEESESLAYPGLRTLYRKRIINARLSVET